MDTNRCVRSASTYRYQPKETFPEWGGFEAEAHELIRLCKPKSQADHRALGDAAAAVARYLTPVHGVTLKERLTDANIELLIRARSSELGPGALNNFRRRLRELRDAANGITRDNDAAWDTRTAKARMYAEALSAADLAKAVAVTVEAGDDDAAAALLTQLVTGADKKQLTGATPPRELPAELASTVLRHTVPLLAMANRVDEVKAGAIDTALGQLRREGLNVSSYTIRMTRDLAHIEAAPSTAAGLTRLGMREPVQINRVWKAQAVSGDLHAGNNDARRTVGPDGLPLRHPADSQPARPATRPRTPMKKRSMAERRRRIEARNSPALPTWRPLTPELRNRAQTFTPKNADQRWATLAPAFVAIIERSETDSATTIDQYCTTTAAFVQWAEATLGLTDPTQIMTEDVITKFIAHGRPGVSPQTRASDLSRLRHLATRWPDSGIVRSSLVHEHKAVKPPYTRRQLADLERALDNQDSDSPTTRQANFCFGAGVGAGLSSNDIRDLRRRDIEIDDRGVTIHVEHGKQPRTVPALNQYGYRIIRGIDGLDPDDLIIGHVASRRNITSAVFSGLTITGKTEPLDQQRLRTTWIAIHLTNRTPLPALMDAAGLTTTRTLADIIAYLERAQDEDTQLREAQS